ncbi:hypothetical protein [Mariniplasma anaerobium]|uniref:Lipoprotein n=1 Tax=Mariniplasma anaerobium TaxID=2735436 RepID=A0A7U9TIP2_9MOLU|nr:hypothetical protein [Mariniplasma anaerobium]BCR36402.1 hypothetical protein MPAN_012950 [Mariniplasma anaerobium]
MKKVSILFCILSVMILSSCSQIKTDNVLEDLKNHSNFTYELKTIVTDEIKSEFSVFGGFGMYTLVDSSIDVYEDDINVFMSDNPVTYYDVSGYPDCTDEYVITRIYTSDPSINVYDYSVGDIYDEEEIILFMNTIGFDKSDNIGNVFENEDVRIILYFDDENIIYKIVVELVSSCSVIF